MSAFPANSVTPPPGLSTAASVLVVGASMSVGLLTIPTTRLLVAHHPINAAEKALAPIAKPGRWHPEHMRRICFADVMVPALRTFGIYATSILAQTAFATLVGNVMPIKAIFSAQDKLGNAAPFVFGAFEFAIKCATGMLFAPLSILTTRAIVLPSTEPISRLLSSTERAAPIKTLYKLAPQYAVFQAVTSLSNFVGTFLTLYLTSGTAPSAVQSLIMRTIETSYLSVYLVNLGVQSRLEVQYIEPATENIPSVVDIRPKPYSNYLDVIRNIVSEEGWHTLGAVPIVAVAISLSAPVVAGSIAKVLSKLTN